ncbi:MAG: PLP-dependent aminotransferase family protein, partial [Acidobacteria bacterium]
GKVLINPGDKVLTENPTYLGALQAFTAYTPDYITVPMDGDGLQVEKLEVALRSGPKFMYLLPNFQNPTGVTMSLERRREVIRLSDHYGIPIIEDDPYGQLRYEGDHIESLEVIDARWRDCHEKGKFTGNVIYLSTFSKTLAPGLRLGWVVAPEEVIHRLVQAKQGTDLQSSTFDQMVAYEVGRGGFIDRHVMRIRDVYGNQRTRMIKALESAFPDPALGVRWTRPQGGLFLWVTLPEKMDTAAVRLDAVKEKVAFVPGAPFYPAGEARNSMRLNFSNATMEQIDEGIARLGRVINRVLDKQTAIA